MSNPCRRAERRGAALAALLAGVASGGLALAMDPPRTPQDYVDRMDGDADGRVDRAEYVAYMIRGFDRMDVDGNGVLEGDELPAGARSVRRADLQRSFAEAFARQDANHDGFLDAREFARPPR